MHEWDGNTHSTHTGTQRTQNDNTNTLQYSSAVLGSGIKYFVYYNVVLLLYRKNVYTMLV